MVIQTAGAKPEQILQAYALFLGQRFRVIVCGVRFPDQVTEGIGTCTSRQNSANDTVGVKSGQFRGVWRVRQCANLRKRTGLQPND